MDAESMLISALFTVLFGFGFACGWYLAKDRTSKNLTFTDWVGFGVGKKWLSRQSAPDLYAAYTEQMADEFDSLPRSKSPTYDREWIGRPS
jgi:hypothetical protein